MISIINAASIIDTIYCNTNFLVQTHSDPLIAGEGIALVVNSTLWTNPC